MRNLHHEPPLASVVTSPILARTCQKYCWRDARLATKAWVLLAVVHPPHDPLVVETHHSYEVAPALVPHVSATGLDRFFEPFDGELFENAPGSAGCAAWVVNDHQASASASVTPAVFVARTCQ